MALRPSLPPFLPSFRPPSAPPHRLQPFCRTQEVSDALALRRKLRRQERRLPPQFWGDMASGLLGIAALLLFVAGCALFTPQLDSSPVVTRNGVHCFVAGSVCFWLQNGYHLLIRRDPEDARQVETTLIEAEDGESEGGGERGEEDEEDDAEEEHEEEKEEGGEAGSGEGGA
jgi:hypothetical protein